MQTGLLSAKTLGASTVSLPALALGIWVGHRFYQKMNDRVFKKALLFILGLTGIALVVF